MIVPVKKLNTYMPMKLDTYVPMKLNTYMHHEIKCYITQCQCAYRSIYWSEGIWPFSTSSPYSNLWI